MVGLSRITVFLLLLSCLSGCASQQGGIYHVVEEGQTLYRIGRVYRVDENKLARVNRISDPSRLQAGTKLFIPGAVAPLKIGTPALRTPDASSPASSQPIASQPQTNVADKSKQPPTVGAKSVNKPTKQINQVPGKGRFAWPLNGTILRRFGTANGTTCQGLEIAVPPRSPVRAAAAGKVIYSGNGIAGYGHLIIIGHEDSFFTVYGFNDKNLVSTGSYVGKGDKIALSGTPPSGGKPRIHFEIRQGKQPLDPLFYLP